MLLRSPLTLNLGRSWDSVESGRSNTLPVLGLDLAASAFMHFGAPGKHVRSPVMLMEAFCGEITWRDKDPEIIQGERERPGCPSIPPQHSLLVRSVNESILDASGPPLSDCSSMRYPK